MLLIRLELDNLGTSATACTCRFDVYTVLEIGQETLFNAHSIPR